MAIEPNDPFDVLRHYILGSYPDGFLSPDSHQELTRALETLQERLDATDATLRWMMKHTKPAARGVDLSGSLDSVAQ